MSTLIVSLVQMAITEGDPEANEARAYERVAESARRGSDVVVLPELWGSGYDLTRAASYASPVGEGLFARVAEWARTFHIWLSGSLLERAEGGLYNTAYLVAPTGEFVATYRKMHLFRLMDEHLYLQAGERPVMADTPWGPVGLGVCYDLRFPELFRVYALRGARWVILPAEWPHPRLHHWRTLVQARAIEEQMFVLACNRVGSAGDTQFFGHSMVVSPWGEVLIEGGEQEVILTTEVNLAEVEQARTRIPVLEDRRDEYA